MESDGDTSLLPASSFERRRSAVPKNYIRNVEAVGSNPITSTRKEQVRPCKPKGRTWTRGRSSIGAALLLFGLGFGSKLGRSCIFWREAKRHEPS